MRKLLFAALIGLGLTTSAYGQSLVTPTSIAFTGSAVEFFTDETNLINSSGITGTMDFANYATATHANASGTNAWVTTAPGGFPSDFFTSGQTVVFDMMLGATINNVDNFVYWGYHFGGNNNNNIESVTFDYGIGNFTGGSQTLTGLVRSTGNAITVGLTPFNADRIRMTVTNNHFGSAGDGGGDRVGLAEIRFTAVPEPTSFAWVSAALAGIVGFRRRRA